jgi:hypothetical protein
MRRSLICNLLLLAIAACGPANKEKPDKASSLDSMAKVREAYTADSAAAAAEAFKLKLKSQASQPCTLTKSPRTSSQTFPFNSSTKVEAIDFDHKSPQRIYGLEYKILSGDQRVVLTKNQTDSLFSILYNYGDIKNTYNANADCYIPRNALIFTNNGKAVGFIEICFQCHKYKLSDGLTIPFCDEKVCMLQYFMRDIGIKDLLTEECDFLTESK